MEIDEQTLPEEVKMLLRTDFKPPVLNSEISKFERFVIEGGSKAAEDAESITGVMFQGEAVAVDDNKLKSFVKEVEGNAGFAVKQCVEAKGEALYSYPNHVAHLAEMCRLSGEPTPKFDAEFLKVVQDVGGKGNMKAVSLCARYLAHRGLEAPGFWGLVEEHPTIVCGGATSGEAATIADSLRVLDLDLTPFFKELVNCFDQSKDAESGREYGADPNYLIPAGHPTIEISGVREEHAPFMRRRHHTTGRDMEKLCNAFAHFKYDSPALFGAARRLRGEWGEGEEGIVKALKGLGDEGGQVA